MFCADHRGGGAVEPDLVAHARIIASTSGMCCKYHGRDRKVGWMRYSVQGQQG